MKQVYLFLFVILTSCIATRFNDNKSCANVQKFEIFQTLDNGGALAYECTFLGGCAYYNQLVYLDWQPNVEYYDGMIVKSPSNKCAVKDGVYKDTYKTVPVVRFEYKNNPKSEEEILERLEDLHNTIYTMCLFNSKSTKKENKEFCNCCAEEFIRYSTSITTQKDVEYSEEEFNKIIEKKCGKFSQFLILS